MADVLIMAGGLGLRLRPLTEDRPKPMVEVGGRPILERMVEHLVAQGFRRILISVHFKAHDIEAHFGDGGNWNANIRYLRETGAAGTGGALQLLPEDVEWPLLVVNGDLLSSADFRSMVAFHEQRRSTATMGLRRYTIAISYGVVNHLSGLFLSMREKPVEHFDINAGIYLLSQEAMAHLPPGRFDMPDLFNRLNEAGRGTPFVFMLDGVWQDIADASDLNHAQRIANAG